MNSLSAAIPILDLFSFWRDLHQNLPQQLTCLTLLFVWRRENVKAANVTPRLTRGGAECQASASQWCAFARRVGFSSTRHFDEPKSWCNYQTRTKFLPRCRHRASRTWPHCGRSEFTHCKIGSCSIIQLFSRPKVSKSHCMISQEPFLQRGWTLTWWCWFCVAVNWHPCFCTSAFLHSWVPPPKYFRNISEFVHFSRFQSFRVSEFPTSSFLCGCLRFQISEFLTLSYFLSFQFSGVFCLYPCRSILDFSSVFQISKLSSVWCITNTPVKNFLGFVIFSKFPSFEIFEFPTSSCSSRFLSFASFQLCHTDFCVHNFSSFQVSGSFFFFFASFQHCQSFPEVFLFSR